MREDGFVDISLKKHHAYIVLGKPLNVGHLFEQAPFSGETQCLSKYSQFTVDRGKFFPLFPPCCNISGNSCLGDLLGGCISTEKAPQVFSSETHVGHVAQ